MPDWFYENASGAGMYEVRISQVAVDKAGDPAVKEFARMMVMDHTQANDELKQFAEAQLTGLSKRSAMSAPSSMIDRSRMSARKRDWR